MSMKTILGSAVIAAVFSGIVSYLISKRQGNLQYITAERKEWREKIREIARQLDGASYKKTLRWFTELKVRINSFGNNGVLNTYASDAHIWKVINELEEEKPSDKVLHQKQKQLIEYLSLLLKMDWERSKKEVKGNIYSINSGICYVLTMCCFAGSIFLSNNNSEYTKIEIATMIAIFGILVIAFHIILTFENKITYDNILNGKYKWSLLWCYCICIVGAVILGVIFGLLLNGAFVLLNNDFQTRLSQILIMILYVFGLGFQVASQNISIENQYYYIQAINKISEKFPDKTDSNSQ